MNAGNDFLAYYNTFYTAKDNFDKAIDIINKSEPNTPIEKSTIILLNQAIDNSLIIESNFYDTKYLDDAYYIIARASFLKGRITASNFYFNELINKYNNGRYYYESLIWIGFLDVLLGNENKINKTIDYLDSNIDKIDSHLDLYYKLRSEVAMYYEIDEDIEKYLLLSLDSTKNKIKKVYLLKQILLLSETNKNYIDCIHYIDLIEENLEEGEVLTQDLLDKWFDYNRNIFNYNHIYSKINNILSSTVSINKEVYYKKQFALTLFHEEKINEAQDIYSLLISDYITDVASKLQFCEINYNLGNIYLYNLDDLEQAKYYFGECKQFCIGNDAMIKKIKIKALELNTSIINYFSLKDEFEYSVTAEISNDNIEDDSINPFMIPQIKNKTMNLSNLLYDMSLILLFDLELKDLAIIQLEEINKNFSDSDFNAKGLFLLSEIVPDSDWNIQLSEKFPNFLNDNSKDDSLLVQLRIDGWSSLGESSEKSIDKFKQVFENYGDTVSLYNIAYIYDEYARNIDSTVKYYKEFVNLFPDNDKSNLANQRIREIEKIISDEIKSLEKKILFGQSFNFINNDSLILDSALTYLNATKNITISIPLNFKIEKIISALDVYQNNLNLIESDTLASDSLIFETAEILLKTLLNQDMSKIYYTKLLKEDNSRFYYYSEQAINYIENNNWTSDIDSTDTLSLIWEIPNSSYKKVVDNHISNLDSYINQLDRLTVLNEKLFISKVDERNSVINLDENSFKFNQSTNQYFYFVKEALIDDIELLDSDWMVAYNNDIVVGSRKYIKGGMIDIPIMGFDDSSEQMIIATDGYCFEGSIPLIKIHRENGDVTNMKVELLDGSLKFQGIGHANVNLSNQ